MDAFQIWCSCGWLSITPFFSQRFTDLFHHSITYSRLHSIFLWTGPSLLLSISLIAKALKHSHIFLLVSPFQVLIFLDTTKNWKDNWLMLTYLWPTFHLRRNQVIYLNWQSAWKIPVEGRYGSKDVARWSVHLLKTLLLSILLVQINYFSPKQVKLLPAKVTTYHYN